MNGLGRLCEALINMADADTQRMMDLGVLPAHFVASQMVVRFVRSDLG